MQVPVYVDSPLAISATEVFQKNTELFEEEIRDEIKHGNNPLEFPGLKFTRTADESRALNANEEPCIIISASGMCEVGRIKHHLKHNLWKTNSTILFVGYQAPGTLGRTIIDGAKNVKIFGEEIAVNARVEYIEGYSGHADQEWLLNFIYSFHTPPKHIFLVHGEEEGQEVLKEKIEETVKIPVTIPNYGEMYDITSDSPVLLNEAQARKYNITGKMKLELINDIIRLKDSISYIEKDVKANNITDDKEMKILSLRLQNIEEQIRKLID